jgi:nitroreductase
MDVEATDPVAILDQMVRSRTSVRAFRSTDGNPRNCACGPEQFQFPTLERPCSDRQGEASAKRVDHAGAYGKYAARIFAISIAYSGARVEDFARRYYSALGIDRADLAARARQTGRNFVSFGAPVGFIFTIHATLTKHSWLDHGLFLQNLMLAAHVRGLAMCPQVSFVRFQAIIAEQLGLDPDELVTCGMSLGYADEQAAVNRLDMPREPVDGFTSWLGFDE